MDTVNIPTEKRFAAFAALYNASRAQGMGFIHATPEPMTEAQAREYLAAQGSDYVDYAKGRVIKTSFAGGQTSLRLFDRDNGTGAAYSALVSSGAIQPA
jgi:hypothetical protein